MAHRHLFSSAIPPQSGQEVSKPSVKEEVRPSSGIKGVDANHARIAGAYPLLPTATIGHASKRIDYTIILLRQTL